MAINFPSSPAVNDTYEYNNIRYVFNGSSWIVGYLFVNRSRVGSGTTLPANGEVGDVFMLYVV